ncbi:MAG: FISUMP domain-containing protein [Bacteroidales bacterium]
MKKTGSIPLFVLFSILLLNNCNKLKQEMLVMTGSVTGITTTSAIISGEVLDLGEGASQHGHCYSTSQSPDISGSKTEFGVPVLGDYSSSLTGLVPETKYYVKAYLSRGKEVVYGNETEFTTASSALPEVTTAVVTGITSSQAVGGGNVTDQGGTPVTARGICWSTATITTITANKTDNGEGHGAFVSDITGLTSGITYYVRAYATNSGGTKLGNEVTFRTLEPPSPITTQPTEITTLSTKLHGQVNTFNFVTDVYFEYGITQAYGSVIQAVESPVSASNPVNVSATIVGLSPNTTYHFRVVANNTQGTTYGNDISFTTAPESVTDIDGNVYPTVTIDNQVWLAQNLRVRRYQNGDFIGTTTPFIADLTDENSPKYQFFYKDALAELLLALEPLMDASLGGYTVQQLVTMGAIISEVGSSLLNYIEKVGIDGGSIKTIQEIYDECYALAESYEIDPYGLYYTWYAASDNRKLCPVGWRIPTDSEIKNLEIYLGMSLAAVDLTGYRGTDEGDKLKESGTLHWQDPNNGTNSTGFNAVPSGIRFYDGSYNYYHYSTYWWTISEKESDSAWSRGLTSSSGQIVRSYMHKSNALSIRCIIDH